MILQQLQNSYHAYTINYIYVLGMPIVYYIFYKWMIYDIKGYFDSMGRDIEKEIEEDNKAIDAYYRDIYGVGERSQVEKEPDNGLQV